LFEIDAMNKQLANNKMTKKSNDRATAAEGKTQTQTRGHQELTLTRKQEENNVKNLS